MHKLLPTLGWDLGGAHIKAVLVDADGSALAAVQHPCPLWRGIEHLESAVSSVMDALNRDNLRHAITMTGELADIFSSRAEGVAHLTQCMAERLPVEEMRVYAGQEGFVACNAVLPHTTAIASANWHASAAFLAAQTRNALFIDIGSTTTDMIVLHQGSPVARGSTDAARLQNEELIYTGVVRTPVMAIAQKVPFGGEWQCLAAEQFATMADVYRLTGELIDHYDQAETADGAGKSLLESARRLARMLGRDYSDASMDCWRTLAFTLRSQQLALLRRAAERALSRGLLDEDAPFVGAGAGRFLVRELAHSMRRPYRDASDVASAVSDVADGVSVCFPAYAVARLAQMDASWR